MGFYHGHSKFYCVLGFQNASLLQFFLALMKTRGLGGKDIGKDIDNDVGKDIEERVCCLFATCCISLIAILLFGSLGMLARGLDKPIALFPEDLLYFDNNTLAARLQEGQTTTRGQDDDDQYVQVNSEIWEQAMHQIQQTGAVQVALDTGGKYKVFGFAAAVVEEPQTSVLFGWEECDINCDELDLLHQPIWRIKAATSTKINFKAFILDGLVGIACFVVSLLVWWGCITFCITRNKLSEVVP